MGKRAILLAAIERWGCCAYCGIEVFYDIYGAQLATIDHITPKSKGGGGNSKSNLTLSCLSCNQIKSNIERLPCFDFSEL